MKPTNAVLCILEIVKFYKTESFHCCQQDLTWRRTVWMLTHPLQSPVAWSMIDLELTTSPKRPASLYNMSSVVSGSSPRM